MKKLTEKQIIALLGIGIGLTASAVVQLAYKLADAKLDMILKKLDMKEETETGREEESRQVEQENSDVTEDMFEE